MGTALQRSVDLLATLPKSDVYTNKEILKTTLLSPDQFQDSMDRMLEQYNRDSLRTTMIKQEEIFKGQLKIILEQHSKEKLQLIKVSGKLTMQVKELHRIYKVQKRLMTELRNNESKLFSPNYPNPPRAIRVGAKCISMDSPNILWNIGTSSEGTNYPSKKTSSGYNFNQLHTSRSNPNTWEQSSSCMKDTSRMRIGFDLEQPSEDVTSAVEHRAEPNSLRSLKDKMAISSPCPNTDAESEVELTLSIGFGTSKKKPKNYKPHASRESGSSERTQMDSLMSIRLDRGDECSKPTNNSSNSKQPPWLFQTLSLNRT